MKPSGCGLDGLEDGPGRSTMSWVVRVGWDKPERNVDVKESSARRCELDCLLSSAVTVRTGRREKNREGLFEGGTQ